jgi:hypothetical protein
MSNVKRFQHTCAIALTTLSLTVGLCPGLSAQPADEAAAGGDTTVDGGWPRGYESPLGATVVVYQPQVAAWDRQEHITAYAAVAYLAKDSEEPALGTIKIESDTEVSVEERLVKLASLKIAEANFPSLEKEQLQDVVAEITDAFPEEDRVIALDRVMAAIDASQIVPKNVDNLKADPPVVFYSAKPAVLVNFEGDPVWSPVRDNTLRFAINTNWDLFQDGDAGPYYLRNDKTWLTAASLTGDWAPAGTLPESFAKLPDAEWTDVKAALPGETLAAESAPKVIVSLKPAELILTEGEPSYKAVEGTNLFWVENTESDLFRLFKDGPFYFLVAGRWFASVDLAAGPWSFATPTLPEDFKTIPADHPRAHVLTSVPGTPDAMEAVLLAQLPKSARVNINEIKAPEVKYNGEPQFEPIEGTSMKVAVNTDKAIVMVGDAYYMCYQGVWFLAATPTGPWAVTNSVPEEIYTIPPSSPVHNITYVTVVDEVEDEWVEYAYTDGYADTYVAWGCPVWGTGYYYDPYVWYDDYYYPVYYSYPYTYGWAARYNPWTGRYGWATGAYGPYGGAGAGAVYNPNTGTYARGAAAYGPNGAVAGARAYNPRTETFASTRQASNVYGSWGSTYVQRGDNWAATKRYTNNATGNTTRVVNTEDGSALIRRGGPGGPTVITDENVFAGQDGNVYRRGESGDWEQVGAAAAGAAAVGAAAIPTIKAKGVKRPQPTVTNRAPSSQQQQYGTSGQRAVQGQAGTYNRPAQSGQVPRPTAEQLNRDAMARQAGMQRTQNYSNYRSGQAAPNPNYVNRGGGANMGGGSRGGGVPRGGGGGRGGGGRGR